MLLDDVRVKIRSMHCVRVLETSPQRRVVDVQDIYWTSDEQRRSKLDKSTNACTRTHQTLIVVQLEVTIVTLLIVVTTRIPVRMIVTVVILPVDAATVAFPPLYALLWQTAVDPTLVGHGITAIRCASPRIHAPAHRFPLPAWWFLLCQHRSAIRYVCVYQTSRNRLHETG